MRRRIISVGFACLSAVSLAVLVAPNADAATGKVITGGVVLNIRSGPSTSDSVVGTVASGTTVSFSCYTQGTAVTGPYGTESVWDRLDSGGYVSDAWIYTGSNSAVVPQCAAASVPAPPALANPTYNRNAAVTWALAHSNDPQAYPAECTWFASNVLWQGGFAKTAAWTSAGSHGTRPVSYRPGTVDAWAVPNFVSYMRANYSVSWVPLGNMSTNAVPQAQPGDIIVYSWDGGKTLDHMAFVVDIASGQYPEVAEWGTPEWTGWTYIYYEAHHPREGYQKRGWTWSQKNHKWLQTEYKGQARAYLLHINGGYFAPSF